MEQQQYNKLFSFLWNIANDVLVQAFEKGDYKKITLPFIVLRRLDLLLADTKQQVLDFSQTDTYRELPEESQENQLCMITRHPFYNVSPFTMDSLRGETDETRLLLNFRAYLDGFSKHVQDVITKFDLRHYVEKLSDVHRLGMMIDKMTDKSINLGMRPVLDDEGNEKLPALDNHTMGTLFEELLRKFNEDYSVTEAGEHYTPRDYVALLADLAVLPVADQLKNGTYDIYDGACGTGGILSIVQERFEEIAREKNRRFKTSLFGQELQPETFATCKADLMLSGNSTTFSYIHNGVMRDRFANGSTISENGHPGKRFDFCISNPPFGTPWKADLEKWGLKPTEKKNIQDPRFYWPDSDKSFIPDIGDPQMLFLANNVSRMKTEGQGTRIVEIHNGSSLFTGNAGGGESNLRHYIIENDMLEAIIAVPLNMFYNTGIGTFVWIVTNRKEERRRGKVQLIDATGISTPLRKNLGNKNCEIDEDGRRAILQLLTRFENNEQSRIFDNREFGYWQITVQRPLRLRVVTDIHWDEVSLKAAEIAECKAAVEQLPAGTPLDDWDAYARQLKLKKTLAKKLRPFITVTDPTAKAVKGEADPKLKDTEQVPLLYEGGISAFMQHEVLPYAPDAYVDEEATVIGYELSFTKYFYKPVELRSVADIEADIRAIEKNTDGLLEEILGDKC
jgi:type I restriction enzyme M protein